MFYNTGISTYISILTNHKKPTRPRRMILVHARECGTKMRKSLGDKHKDLWPERSRDRAAVREGAGYDSNIEENPRGMSGSM